MKQEENFFEKESVPLCEVENQAVTYISGIWHKTYNLVKEILALTDSYEIFLLDSESDPIFSIAALLFSKGHGDPVYLETGISSAKAIEKAKLFGEVKVITCYNENDYSYEPNCNWEKLGGSYLHITIGNLNEGTQIKKIPKVAIPIIADASSGLCSIEIILKNFDLLYCIGGPGNCHFGVTMVIAKREFLTDFQRSILARYAIYPKNNYSKSTVSNLENFLNKLNWIVEVGGLSTLIFLNQKKALMLYREIERNKKFYCLIKPDHRADGSVLFAAFNHEDEESFINFSKTLESRLVVSKNNNGLLVVLENTDTIDDVEQLVICFQYFEDN